METDKVFKEKAAHIKSLKDHIVEKADYVIHVGDFCFKKSAEYYIKRLNGNHIFIKGNHDRWLKRPSREIWSKKINDQKIVFCHYPMRRWPGWFYGSWNLHGDSHGKLKPILNQYDVGVDNNNFYPIPFDEMIIIIRDQNDYLESTIL